MEWAKFSFDGQAGPCRSCDCSTTDEDVLAAIEGARP
jgi:hypothetical protein